MSWDNDLKTALRSLECPEHRPEFWDQLGLLLEEEAEVRQSRRTRNWRWTAPIGIVAAIAAVLVGLMIALPSSLTATVLAYSFPEGAYTYDISYFETHHAESTGEGSIVPGPDVSTEAEGTLTYTVEAGPEAGTKIVVVQANVTDLNLDCGHTTCAEDLELFRDIPELRHVVDSNGEFVRTLSPDTEEGWPALVLPDPLPGANLSAGLPFGFGPQFPDHPLDVGDTWTTSGPRSAFWEDGPQFSAEHTVTGRETVVGRDTFVISSIYQTPAPGTTSGTDNGFGTETSEVTVWFDPEAGIIVRAELDYATENDDGPVTSTSTTQIVVELIDEQ
jgi:hypothetical protein